MRFLPSKAATTFTDSAGEPLSLFMGVLESAGHLDRVIACLGDRDRSRSFDQLPEVLSLDLLHHEDKATRRLHGPIRGNNVRVIKTTGGLDLAVEPRDILWAIGQVLLDDLERLESL
jgi:hypothetical protein